MSTEDKATKQLLQILKADDASQLKRHIQEGHWDPKGFFLQEESFPVRWAADFGKLECLRVLLQYQEEQPESAEGSLIEAVLEGREQVVRLLVDEGVPAEGLAGQYTHNTDEDSPISAALAQCSPTILEVLCKAGGIQRSEVEWLEMGLINLLDSRKKARDSCLLMAARELVFRIEQEPDFSLSPEVMKKVADRLKKLGKKSEKPGDVPALESAIRRRFNAEAGLREELITFIMEDDTANAPRVRQRLMNQGPEARQRLASAALPYLASLTTSFDYWDLIVEMVDSWGAEIDQKDGLGRTSLANTCQSMDVVSEPKLLASIRFLLEHQANPNVLDVQGFSPLALHLTRGQASPDLVKLLRSYGAKTYEELGVPYPRYTQEYFDSYPDMPPLGESSK